MSVHAHIEDCCLIRYYQAISHEKNARVERVVELTYSFCLQICPTLVIVLWQGISIPSRRLEVFQFEPSPFHLSLHLSGKSDLVQTFLLAFENPSSLELLITYRVGLYTFSNYIFCQVVLALCTDTLGDQ